MFLEALQFSISTTLPTILLMFAGISLRRKKYIDDHFCNMASKSLFNFAIPTLLFLNMQKGELNYAANIPLILTAIIGTLTIYLVAEWWAGKYIADKPFRAVFTQGTFRSNIAILGLALIMNAYGSEAMASASIYVAVSVILFNTLAVITLTKAFSDGKPKLCKLFISILKNPLIIGLVLGLIFNELKLELPTPLLKTGQAIGGLTLPLALICTGASIDFKQLRKFKKGEDSTTNRLVLLSASIRLFVAPVFLFSLGKWVFDLSPMELGIVFLSTSAPTAAATYAMIRNYGGDAVSTANLIGITTVGSMFTSSFGLLILRQLGWV
ncbi:AEC family transporter [Actinobacillus equuli]|uniref:AEC family transporter n=1 Tax=Actinobacillus equuli TaxID=718 RepID=UPI0024412097|nr:AEC family transporter [Actinobacillus equuli]WGE47629.1 AEC family transporter [Actinobacillus equuli subsp. haemolyticus]WGE86594.1 AEC family transporter [Actinobacillus equuli subsp. haemolyticus]